MKFKIVLKSKTQKGNDLILKLNVPPSKHQGLINFLKIALESNNDVTFTIEKSSSNNDDVEESTVYGEFKFQKKA